MKLYELAAPYPQGKGWKAGSGAIFDLNSNKLGPAGWTSADAAGLPIFPGLVRYDEAVEQKANHHTLRFTVVKTPRGYGFPAPPLASNTPEPDLPPLRVRVPLITD